jgi:hypothetical protein
VAVRQNTNHVMGAQNPAHKKMRFGDRRRLEMWRDQMRCEGLINLAAY